jgi:hypothetical protein
MNKEINAYNINDENSNEVKIIDFDQNAEILN